MEKEKEISIITTLLGIFTTMDIGLPAAFTKLPEFLLYLIVTLLVVGSDVIGSVTF